MALLEFTDRGICCPLAGVYLDPWKPVPRALITHGHSDHAHAGHEQYLCTPLTAPIIRHRLALTETAVQTAPYGDTCNNKRGAVLLSSRGLYSGLGPDPRGIQR